MFASNFTKFFLFFALIFSLFSGCGFRQPGAEMNSPATPAVSEELKSGIPFSNKEPEQFQAEIVVTAGGAARRGFVARNGAARRWDFNFGAKNQLTALHTDKNYLILPARKIYTENASPEAAASDDWTNFLTTEWLNEKRDASFEKLEPAENLTRYRVRLDDGGASEIFVYVDETLGLPVRQEFYALGGEQKTLVYSFELKNAKLETDANLFAIPPDCKKVAAQEFRQILQSNED
jgi:hypothetical protein